MTGLKEATAEADLVRGIFFVMTFFSIGMASNFKRLWAEGIGRLALVYVISLFGFIIWIGLAISWLFFHGVHPPLITGRSLICLTISKPDEPGPATTPSLARELEAIPYEPLLPIEKKLIVWCLLLGVVLLGVLLWASATFFPVVRIKEYHNLTMTNRRISNDHGLDLSFLLLGQTSRAPGRVPRPDRS